MNLVYKFIHIVVLIKFEKQFTEIKNAYYYLDLLAISVTKCLLDVDRITRSDFASNTSAMNG